MFDFRPRLKLESCEKKNTRLSVCTCKGNGNGTCVWNEKDLAVCLFRDGRCVGVGSFANLILLRLFFKCITYANTLLLFCSGKFECKRAILFIDY